MPGKIIQGLRRVGTRNPVFMLDELDKIGSDWRGDPASALLEVLDPAQNHSFADHYLDLPFDLTGVLFIATANVSANIPAPLLDRTELISLPGYLPQEKQAIGISYLLPRQLEAHGLSSRQLKISKRTVGAIVEGYTREAGVRQLERSLGRICRKRAARVAELRRPRRASAVSVTPKELPDYLGPRRYHRELAQRVCRPGVVVGLAWTAVGGEILFIEATTMAGSGRFQLTGKLGDVMSESARIAYSLVRSRADQFRIPSQEFKERDIHLHVPAGAVPKDGPSAGVAMTCALLSLLWRGKGRRARSRVAMTGEITLRGSVLPVGGIREKIIGAKTAGVKTVVVPRRNQPDVEKLPENMIRGLKIVFADELEEAVEAAIGPIPPAP
jgi:ATP-dependent Lon protease